MTITVLIVDDDASLRVLVSRQLGRLGYHVLEAANGAEAEAKVIEIQPKVVLLDIMMPLQNGYATCANLRKQGYDGGIVMISAMEKAANSERLFALGGDDYLEKPVRLDELGRCLISCLVKRELHKEKRCKNSSQAIMRY